MKNSKAVGIILVVISSVVSQAQIKQGVYSASGAISYSSSKSEAPGTQSESMALSLSPGISYFVFDNIEISFTPSYSKSTNESETFTPVSIRFDRTAISLGAGLGVRYYVDRDAIAPFLGVATGLSWSKSSGTALGSFSPPFKFYAIEAGLDYFLSETFAVEPALQYNSSTFQSFSSSGFRVKIGVKYFVL